MFGKIDKTPVLFTVSVSLNSLQQWEESCGRTVCDCSPRPNDKVQDKNMQTTLLIWRYTSQKKTGLSLRSGCIMTKVIVTEVYNFEGTNNTSSVLSVVTLSKNIHLQDLFFLDLLLSRTRRHLRVKNVTGYNYQSIEIY